MKKIALKKVTMEVNGQTVDLNYKNQLISIMQTPSDPQRGANYEEVRKSIRILEKLEAAENEVELEDADFEYMKQRVLGAGYLMINKTIQGFIEDVTNPKE
jgi:hypothetical protein